MAGREGESAVSTGPMVPVLASNDVGRSRAVLSLLEANGIPALLDVDLNGAFVGFHDPVPEGWTQVLVPTSMRGEALEVLKEHESEFHRPLEGQTLEERPASIGRAPSPSNPVGALSREPPTEPASSDLWGRPPSGRSFEPAVPGLASGDDLEDERRELALPEPAPLQGRLTIALAAIVFGGVMQQGLSALFGPESVLRRLGAVAPVFDELHRLVTASFLHGGFSHFASNAAFGLVFGVVLFGTHRVGATALTWLVASMVGIGAELSLSPEALVVGASAGNYGLVGLWARGQMERAQLSMLPKRERMKTLGVLLLLIPGALTPFSSTGTRIAVLAHAVGFLAGLLGGLVFHRRLVLETFEAIDERSRMAGVAAVMLTAVGWTMGLTGFFFG